MLISRNLAKSIQKRASYTFGNGKEEKPVRLEFYNKFYIIIKIAAYTSQ